MNSPQAAMAARQLRRFLPLLALLGIFTYLVATQFVLGLPVVKSVVILLAGAFAAIVFFKPLWGYYGLMASFGAALALTGAQALTASKLLGAMVFLSWALEGLFRRSYRFPRSPVLALVPLFYATALLSAFAAENARLANPVLGTLLQLGALVFITASIVQKPVQVRHLAWVMLLSTLVSISYGLFSVRAGTQFAMEGLVGNRNRFGLIIALCIPLVFYLYPRSGRLARSVLLVLMGVLVLAEGLTYSRGGFLAMLLSLALSTLFVVRSQRGRLGIWVVLLLVGLGIAMPANYWARMGTILPSVREGKDSVGLRYQLWEISLKMIHDHPLTGVGPGNFLRQFSRYSGIVSLKREALSAHNSFLGVTAEQGIPGGLLFTALLLSGFVSLRRSYHRARDRGDVEVMDLSICFAVILFVLLSQCMKGNYEHNKYLWVTLGISVALQGMALRKALPEPEAEGKDFLPEDEGSISTRRS